MNIKREDIDSLNAIVTVDIAKEDYSENVEKILKNYRKTANIPGFRKGQVPMGMVKKQYGKAVLVDEVNKLLDQALNKYLTEEKLDVLGNPLPKEQANFDWDADDYKFEFELGLTPEFELDLQPKKAITSYKIIADDKMIDSQIERIQKQYGKLEAKDTVAEGDLVAGTFKNEEEGIENTTTLPLEKLKGKANLKKFVGAKVGDTISLKTKGLFEDDHDLMEFLKVEHDKAHGLDIPVTFEITEANKQIPAELDQELFDKLFGKDTVKTVTEMKEKIKEDAEGQFKQQSDQQLLTDVSEYLIENTKFDLPAEFLQRWIKATSEEEITLEQSKEEYEKSEKGLRFQLIEAKLIKDNNLNVNFEDLKAFAKDRIKMQMAQFGQMNPSDKELEDIAARVLGNQDEVKRMTEQLMNERLLGFYKENVKLKEKEMSYEDFVKEVYE
ncbi:MULTISPECIES: trigger factor [Croceibacter]|jgi:trigger factor|uniref:Trigger factor n=1 Tax=Croceibacter atlanticus (strain ATCC BAA-628 / JCM 21780 / CIP 108009 / IAM 15332 / KCTC 12090 / HTCC2559) TaxID=216432 RepID=A3U6U5_CROAH|nr:MULTISPECIES: trigger factor [Croceibacter]HAT70611.1 trigger factor [Flavobacteriaceae bacterium]EAP87962.1 putative cell division trigger factor [Croceibacter atlanticus HTCC2559]MAM22599.1 trigger factor [Croceibacter sp.]MBG25460.1 trigger factor [Croceibacter sp.]MBW4969831.1 trigger factor [Croceibacter atlanticus]|tara:strand:- start:2835 stop:4157 length:1323 start_codon:yes stop_codon:yes gene_type:complete